MVWQALAVAIIGVIAVVIIRQIKPELAMFAGIATGIMILLVVADGISEAIASLESIKSVSDSGNGIFKTVVKIVGIGYITEYGASICEDYGSSSIAKKVQLTGKVSIFLLAIPIITQVVSAVEELVS